jgi:hypothetical protein
VVQFHHEPREDKHVLSHTVNVCARDNLIVVSLVVSDDDTGTGVVDIIRVVFVLVVVAFVVVDKALVKFTIAEHEHNPPEQFLS